MKIVFHLFVSVNNNYKLCSLSDLSSATDALDLINGYNFKGKPIIIQYGKIPTT